jgi:hypothetical protein
MLDVLDSDRRVRRRSTAVLRELPEWLDRAVAGTRA